MKRINCILVLFTVCFLAFSSCKKSSPAVPDQQNLVTSISLKFSGNIYVCPTAVAIYYKHSGIMQIEAQFDNDSRINLTIVNVQAGTFDLSGGRASLSFSTGLNVPDAFVSNSGSAVVTEFSSTSIIGTFQFSGTDGSNVTRDITEGQFVIGYSTQ